MIRMLRPLGLFIIAVGLLLPGLRATAETPLPTGLPPALVPLMREIQARTTPAQLAGLIQKSSPTAWKLITDKARSVRTGTPPAFSSADFARIPKTEQEALIQNLQPIVTQAMGRLTTTQQLELLQAVKSLDPSTLVFPVLDAAGISQPR